MAAVLGTAEIQVFANASGVGQQLERELRPAGQLMNRVLTDSIRDASKSFDHLGVAARVALDDVDFDDAFDGLNDGVVDAGRVMTRELGQASNDSVRIVERSFDGVDDRIATDLDVGDEFRRITADLVTESRGAVRRIESEFDSLDFDDAFDGITAGLTTEVNTAGRILSRELGQASVNAARQVDQAFDGMDARIGKQLDATDEFRVIGNELRAEARDLTRRIESEFSSLDFDQAFDGIDDGIELTRRLAVASSTAARQIEQAFDGIGERIGDDLDATDEFDRMTADLRAQARSLVNQLETEFGGAGQRIRSELAGVADVDIGDRVVVDAGRLAGRVVAAFDGVGADIADELDVDTKFKAIASRLESTAATAAAAVGAEFTRTGTGIESVFKSVNASGLTNLVGTASRVASNVAAEFAPVARKIETAMTAGVSLAAPLAAEASKAANRVVGEFAGTGKEIGNDIVAGVEAALGKLPQLVGGIATAAGGALTIGFANAISRSAATDKIAGSLGLTPAEATELGRITGNLYANAYGESFENVGQVVRDAFTVDIPTDQLEKVVARGFALQDAFGGAANEYITLSAQLRNQGVIDDVTEGLDLITVAFQRLPSTLQEPLSEALREYGIFATQLGLSAEEAFSLFTAAAQRGEFELDRTGDALKEFGIRATDLSSTSKEAFDTIGLDMKEMADTLLRGGDDAGVAFRKIVEGLLAIDNESDQAAAAIALFGTPLEDLSVNEIPNFLRSLLGVEGGFDNVVGAVDRLDTTLYDNFPTTLETFKRSFENAFTAIAEEIIGPVLAEIQPLLNEFAAWMREEGPNAAAKISEILVPTFNDLRDALNDVDWEGVFNTIKEALEDIDWEGVADAIGEFIAAVFNFDWAGFAEDVVETADAIATLVDAVTDLIGYGVDIKDFFDSLPGDGSNPIAPWADTIRDIIGSLDEMGAAFSQGKDDWAADWDEIKGFGETAKGIFGEVGDDWAEDWDEIGRWFSQGRDDWAADWDEIKAAPGVAQNVIGEISEDWGADWDELMGWFEQGKRDWAADWDEIKGFASDAAAKMGETWEDIKTGLGGLRDVFSERWEEIKQSTNEKFTQIRTDAATKFQEVRTAIVTKFEEIRSSVAEKVGQLRADTAAKFEEIRANIATKAQDILTQVGERFSELRNRVSTIAGEIRDNVAERFESLRTRATELIRQAAEAVTSRFENLRTSVSELATQAKDAVTSRFETLRANAANLAFAARDAVVTQFIALRDRVAEMIGSARDRATELMGSLVGNLREKAQSAHAAVTEWFGKIKTFLSNLFSGVSLGSIDISGLTSKLDTLVQKINSAIDTVNKIPGVNIPKVSTGGGGSTGSGRSFTPTSTRSTGAATGGRTGLFGEGGLATAPGIVSEDYKPEIVLPLTKPDRMIAIMRQYASEIIAASGGVEAVAEALASGRNVTGPAGVAFGVTSGDIRSPAQPQGVPFTGRVNPAGRERAVGRPDIPGGVTHNHFYGVEAGTVAKQMRDNDRSIIRGLRVRP